MRECSPRVPFVVAISWGLWGSSADCSVPLESSCARKTARAAGWWESLTPHLEPSSSKVQIAICNSLCLREYLKHKPKTCSLGVYFLFVISLTCAFIPCNTRKHPRAHHQWCSYFHKILKHNVGYSSLSFIIGSMSHLAQTAHEPITFLILWW